MNRGQCSANPTRLLRLFMCAAVVAWMWLGSVGLAYSAEKESSKSAPASKLAGKGITTQIQREVERGAPSEEDEQHITVLGAQVLHQIARARNAIDADDSDAAQTAVGKARKALSLIGQLLPKSVVTVTVFEGDDIILYEDAEDVQPEYVTVSRSFTSMDVVRPIIESKKDTAEITGNEFEGAAMIEADVVLNLGYLNRRLSEAERALPSNMDRADEALAKAQSQGTSLVITAAAESPLDEAREALQYAHQAAEKKQYQAAEANLRIARGYLLLYRQGAADDAKPEIDELNKEMDNLSKQISGTTSKSHEETTGRVKKLLDRVESWWHRSGPSGQATTAPPPKPQAAK